MIQTDQQVYVSKLEVTKKNTAIDIFTQEQLTCTGLNLACSEEFTFNRVILSPAFRLLKEWANLYVVMFFIGHLLM